MVSIGDPAAASGGARAPLARRSTAGILRSDGFLVVGGFGAGGSVRPDAVLADIWRYSGDGWRQLTDDAGEPARYPSLVDHGGRLIRFGGCGWEDGAITFENTVWQLDEAACRWIPITVDARAPMPAGRYTAALAALPDAVAMFGGTSQSVDGTNHYYGDLWHFEPDARQGRWTRMQDGETGPGPLYGFGWCQNDRHLFIFGGYDGRSDSAAFWSLDLVGLAAGNIRWTKLPDGPAARYCPSLGIVGGEVVVFGGRSKRNSKLNFDDSWVFNLESETWRQVDGAGPGYHAKSAYGSDGENMFVFGGEGRRGHVSDLWVFRDGIWTRLTAPSSDDPVLW